MPQANARPFVERRKRGLARFLQRRTLFELIIIVMVFEPDWKPEEIAEACEVSVRDIYDCSAYKFMRKFYKYLPPSQKRHNGRRLPGKNTSDERGFSSPDCRGA